MSHEIKRLYRARDDSRVAGVCAGVGEFFRVDPVLVRLAWVVVTIFTGFVPGLLAYLLAWAIVPEEPRPATTQQSAARTHEGSA